MEAFLVALDVPGPIKFYQGFNIPNLIPDCFGNFPLPLFLPG